MASWLTGRVASLVKEPRQVPGVSKAYCAQFVLLSSESSQSHTMRGSALRRRSAADAGAKGPGTGITPLGSSSMSRRKGQRFLALGTVLGAESMRKCREMESWTEILEIR